MSRSRDSCKCLMNLLWQISFPYLGWCGQSLRSVCTLELNRGKVYLVQTKSCGWDVLGYVYEVSHKEGHLLGGKTGNPGREL